MGAEFAAVLFGLASAITWGGGDFFGGLASRRAPLLMVLLVSEAAGLVLVIALALLFGEALPAAPDMLWGALAGVAGTLGIGSLYRGLSVGRASVVAPTSAVLAAALPAMVGIASDGLPGTTRLAGFVVALLGIWLVARSPTQATGDTGIGLALLAGVAFGGFFVLIHRASSGGTFWPLVAARGIAIPLTLVPLLARRHALTINAAALQSALLAGALDISGNALFVLAGQRGRLDVAAILASLYPASTVVLSRIVLKERVSWVQSAGVGLTLVAIALIAA